MDSFWEKRKGLKRNIGKGKNGKVKSMNEGENKESI